MRARAGAEGDCVFCSAVHCEARSCIGISEINILKCHHMSQDVSDPRGYEGVVLVARVRPVPAGHHAAEPLLEAVHCPRLVEVGLSQRNVADKLLEHRLLLVHAPHLEQCNERQELRKSEVRVLPCPGSSPGYSCTQLLA